MRQTFTATLFAISIALSGCFFDDGGSSSTSVKNENTAGNSRNTNTLTISKLTSSQIVIPYAQSIYSYCSQSYDAATATYSQILKQDTSKASIDTVNYKLAGNLLLIGGDTSLVGTTGKVLRYYLYSRVSGSTGSIVGTWSATFRDSLYPLNIPETDSALRSRRTQSATYASSQLAAGRSTLLNFTSNSITVTNNRGNWAMQEMADWNQYDSNYYALTVTMLDANTMTYTSRKSLASSTVETVTAIRLDDSRTQYSSTNSVHATYIANDNPTSVAQCPENRWFGTFMSANIKSSASARAATEFAPIKTATRWY
jgi:hypothetical protein